MQTGNVATPFGARPMTLALVQRQRSVSEIEPGKKADKWKIFRDASAAFEKLGLQSNSLAVLDALLSFYPENELRHDAQMIVFPSNVQLCLRAHSMAGATLRRHLAALVEAGLIIRRDSPNGKRYARRNRSGDVERAYGFDLSPLLSRSEELALLSQEIAAEREMFRRAKESLTVSRRDCRKLISAAREERVSGDWERMEDAYLSLVARIPRSPNLADLVDLSDEMELLREEVINRLEIQGKTENNSTSAALNEQHIQNSESEYIIEFEPSSEKEQGAKVAAKHWQGNPVQAFPLGIVLKACPQVSDYGPREGICSWRELMSAAVVIRSALGISPSAYQNACSVMGPENAATAVACILERAHMINSAGGYLRNLTQRSTRGEFSLGPMIMALLKSYGSGSMARAG